MYKLFAILLLALFTGMACTDTGGTDSDADGVIDTLDNCPDTYNPSQTNLYGGAAGDACEDTDGDGSMDADDPCPTDATDSCGTVDTDGDGFNDDVDNCVTTPNPSQADNYGTSLGDACEDTDGDSVLDDTDNCPVTANAGQENNYGTSAGDACEDTDGDGANDDVDPCPEDATDACVGPTGYYYIVNVNDGKCAWNKEGTSDVMADDCQLRAKERWKIIPDSGKFRLENEYDNRCAYRSITRVKMETCGGDTWDFVEQNSGDNWFIQGSGLNYCWYSTGTQVDIPSGACLSIYGNKRFWEFYEAMPDGSMGAEVNPNTL